MRPMRHLADYTCGQSGLAKTVRGQSRKIKAPLKIKHLEAGMVNAK